MGYALAAAAIEAGHRVVLISGPVCLPPPAKAEVIPVTTAETMHAAVVAEALDSDVLVMCAAVADYRAREIAPRKIKKSAAAVSLELVPTRDILRSLPATRDYLVVGFAAETEEIAARARAKLAQKNCDMVVANDVSDPAIGMESDENAVTVFFRNGKSRTLPRATKSAIASELVKIICANAKKVLTKKI